VTFRYDGTMQAPLNFAVDNRLPEMLERLTHLLPPRKEAAATNPLDQLLYGVIAQGLSSSGATACYRRVRQAYPSFAGLRDAKPEALRALLIGVPAASLKAAALPEILRLIEDAFGALSLDSLRRLDTEMALRFLTKLPRVNDDIAVAVLRFTGTERSVMQVDRDVARPLRRLGLVEAGAPLSALPRQLIERAPVAWRSADFAGLSRGLGTVAARWCHQGKPDCAHCPLASLCPTAEKSAPAAKVLSFPFGALSRSRPE
jgi:endonuclease-3